MLQCVKQQYDAHCKDNTEAKGLYGVRFPHFNLLAAIWGKDIATGEGAKGIGQAVTNMEKEVHVEDNHGHEEEERGLFRTPPRISLDSCSADSTSSSKRRKKDNGKGKEASLSNDPLLAMVADFRADLQGVAKQFVNVAAAMQREVEVQEKAQKEPEETIEEKSIKELHKLGFTGTKVIKAASVFVRIPNQMTMLFAISESLRREFVLNMLEEEANKKNDGKLKTNQSTIYKQLFSLSYAQYSSLAVLLPSICCFFCLLQSTCVVTYALDFVSAPAPSSSASLSSLFLLSGMLYFSHVKLASTGAIWHLDLSFYHWSFMIQMP